MNDATEGSKLNDYLDANNMDFNIYETGQLKPLDEVICVLTKNKENCYRLGQEIEAYSKRNKKWMPAKVLKATGKETYFICIKTHAGEWKEIGTPLGGADRLRPKTKQGDGHVGAKDFSL